MRLIAFRGANTVAANEPDAILDATEALMHELLGRNGLETGDLVSCLFTRTPTTVTIRSTSTSGRPRRCARTCTARSSLTSAMPIEFAERIRRIPVYPAADGYALPGDVALLASNESPYPPISAVVDAITAAVAEAHRYPDPT